MHRKRKTHLEYCAQATMIRNKHDVSFAILSITIIKTHTLPGHLKDSTTTTKAPCCTFLTTDSLFAALVSSAIVCFSTRVAQSDLSLLALLLSVSSLPFCARLDLLSISELCVGSDSRGHVRVDRKGVSYICWGEMSLVACLALLFSALGAYRILSTVELEFQSPTHTPDKIAVIRESPL